jgi:hypothetical protein
MTRTARLTSVGHRFEGINESGTVAGDVGLALRGGSGLARYAGFTLGQTPFENVDVKILCRRLCGDGGCPLLVSSSCWDSFLLEWVAVSG